MKIISPIDAISKAYKRVTVNRDDITKFRSELAAFLSKIGDSKTEARVEGYQHDFLRNTFYRNYDITKPDDNKIDAAIRLNIHTDSPVGVIVENKTPSNRREMITIDDPNRKAMQELVYYYLKERIEKKNTDVRRLIATNMYEVFIFDAALFEKLFYNNNDLCREFKDFQQKLKPKQTTDFFYDNIAAKYIDKVKDQLECVFLDLRAFASAAVSEDEKGLRKLVVPYKLLSNTFMMKLPVGNDYNTLNTAFYSELLYIIGLKEVKVKGKPVLVKLDSRDTNSASLMDLTIDFVEKKLHGFLRRKQYGDTEEEQIQNICLELCITWVNRLLFLRLLESQIIRYHDGDTRYRILGYDRIDSFQMLNRLFFDVLAVDYPLRKEIIKNSPLNNVPYLNSSLFELTDLEKYMLTVSALPNDMPLPIVNGSVLKKVSSQYRTKKELPTLQYLLAFLDSYRFASQEEGGIEDTKDALINASVLGLIFEKINGHKDGAVFTPAFITSSMSRPAVERAVVRKFNTVYGWQCKDAKDLYNRLDRALDHDLTIEEANATFNSIRIADISVGSGHFLVSVLGEMIRLKFYLGILTDTRGEVIRRRDYDIDVVNDELTVLNSDKTVFTYKPGATESQRIQEALFHEKKTLIENCLFGVDLNANSVGICRLRLWIELLKNAYYTSESNYEHLQTLPNLDINIKQGDSLLSKFKTEDSISQVLANTKIKIKDYKQLVSEYKATADKKVKHQIEDRITEIKQHLSSGLTKSNEDYRKLSKKRLQMQDLHGQKSFFEAEGTEDALKAAAKLQIQIEALEIEVAKLRIKIEDDSKRYEGSFEWRFEFPEILDATGNFLGFDLIIGNPPYIQLQADRGKLADAYAGLGYTTFKRSGDIYCLFIERACQLLADGGELSLITSNKWLKADYGGATRVFVDQALNPTLLLDFGANNVFENAAVLTDILVATKNEDEHQTRSATVPKVDYKDLPAAMRESLSHTSIQSFVDGWPWLIADPVALSIKKKMDAAGQPLAAAGYRLNYGVKTGRNDVFIISTEKRNEILAACQDEDERQRTGAIIRKIIKGENIKRNKVEWGGEWLINTHNGLKGINKEVILDRIHIEEYPALRAYLDNNWGKIKDRSDQGDTPYNLRNCAYLLDFDEPKIVWGNLNLSASYAMDTDRCIVNAPANQIVPASPALLRLLNSRLADWYVRQLGVTRNGGYFEYKPMFVGQLPVPEDISVLDNITDERQIDEAVCRLYGLSEEETKTIIDNNER